MKVLEFLKSGRFMLILFAVIFVAAAVLVAVGVLTHEEPGLSRPEARWDHVPLLVSASPYSSEGERPAVRDETLDDVLDTVNSRLGFDALRWAEPGEEPDVIVVLNAPVEAGGEVRDAAGGHFELRGSGTTWNRCLVWTMNVAGPTDLPWLTLYHEMGHCLGLAHDDYALSIMYPEQRPTPDGTIPPWISDSDRALLRSTYSPR